MAVDVLAGLALAADVVLGATRSLLPPPAWLIASCATLLGTAVAGRRRYPVVAAVTATMSSLVMTYLGVRGEFLLGAALAVYIVATTRRVKVSLAVTVMVQMAAAVMLTLRSAIPSGRTEPEKEWLVLVVLIQVIAWGAGTWVRQRRHYQRELMEQAEMREQARLREAVTDERLRIARELHDVMAGSMSVIALRASVGSHIVATHPEEAAASLALIETTSRAALNEIRALVGALRSGPDPAEPYLPPTLAGLGTLLDSIRSAGLSIQLSLPDRYEDLPPGLQLSAYRIIQEALTNTLKHAHASQAWVAVSRTRQHLQIQVTDNGTGPSSPNRPGHGLIGMRERAALYSGDISVGARPGGGFRVTARFPLADRPEPQEGA
ncbi:sensor histidine kinase [Actinomadura rupiterrae]|uniref:sensor histidine kinase n=1 Tax=Actinomadura rupiterrae TaxID=559627 RepID=UPI0020A49AD2|nr:sensor histidine kinase [Actinomadura rupiterrae]MCP2343174.1 signal transduction histidine kinase [Actinomadura rupiterrae]